MVTSSQLFQIGADRQAAENERERADTAKALHEAATYKTVQERRDAKRAALYQAHKVRGSLGTYYAMYPTDPGAQRFYAEQAYAERDRER